MNEAAAITCLFLDIGGVLLAVILTTHLCCSRQNSRVGSDGHRFSRTFKLRYSRRYSILASRKKAYCSLENIASSRSITCVAAGRKPRSANVSEREQQARSTSSKMLRRIVHVAR